MLLHITNLGMTRLQSGRCWSAAENAGPPWTLSLCVCVRPSGQELTRDERTQKLHLVRNAWMAVVHIWPGQLVYNRSDPRSDLFALGVLMHFFATGQRPFGDPVKVGERRCRLRPHSAAGGPRRHSTMVSRTQLAPPTDAKARPAPAGEPAFDLQHPDCNRADRTVSVASATRCSRW
jgi:hypothetical protein